MTRSHFIFKLFTTQIHWVVIIFLVNTFWCYGQDLQRNYLSYSVGFNSYFSNEVQNTQGPIQIEPQTISTYSLGLDYKSEIVENWKFSFGFRILNQPVTKYSIDIPERAINSIYAKNESADVQIYSLPTIDISILFEHHFAIQRNLSLSPYFGYRYLYFPRGMMSHKINLDLIDNEDVLLYRGRFMSSKNPNYHNVILGIGLNRLTESGLFSIQAGYNYSFRNVIEGEYETYNMNPGYESSGEFVNKGHFYSLSLAYAPLSKSKKIKQKYLRISDDTPRDFKNYFPVGLSISFDQYAKGKNMEEQGGEYLKHYAFKTLSISLDALIPLDSKFSIRSGLKLSRQPNFNIMPVVDPDNFGENYFASFDQHKDYSRCFSAPFMLDYRMNISTSNYFQIFGGVNVLYAYDSVGYYILSEGMMLNDPEKVVFHMVASTSSSRIHFGAMTGVAFTRLAQKGEWSLLFKYNLPFKPVVQAEYSFQNMVTQDDYAGKFQLRGDYFSISMAYFPKFHKKEKR